MKSCSSICVDKDQTKESQKEKYLGDFLKTHANPKATIQDRKNISHINARNKMLYLETGEMEIGHVVAVRRLCYLKTIFNRPDGELLKKVYEAQRNEPCKGDWIKIIQADMEQYNLNLSDGAIQNMDDHEYKKTNKK